MLSCYVGWGNEETQFDSQGRNPGQSPTQKNLFGFLLLLDCRGTHILLEKAWNFGFAGSKEPFYRLAK